MNQLSTMYTGVAHQLHSGLRTLAGRTRHGGRTGDALDTVDRSAERDRGAVSLEQVLWFVAAGLAVAVIAGILWQTIRDEADKPITDFEPPEG